MQQNIDMELNWAYEDLMRHREQRTGGAGDKVALPSLRLTEADIEEINAILGLEKTGGEQDNISYAIEDIVNSVAADVSSDESLEYGETLVIGGMRFDLDKHKEEPIDLSSLVDFTQQDDLDLSNLI